MTPAISVVIPALDEEACIGAVVRSAASEAGEVLVVDGGSRDRTREQARAAGAVVLTTRASRGVQLDAGAHRAQGQWLVFLHADTRLEAGWAAVLVALDARVCGGAFRFAIDAPRSAYRILEAGVGLRCRLLGLPYGDQAVFVRREVYGRIGGFPPLPLMEDVVFARRLARFGPLAFPAVRAFTSPRRWEQRGLVAATIENWWLLALFLAGCPPERLARRYRGVACS